MAEKIKFDKKVYDKKSYIKTIDTSFKELGIESIEEAAQPTLPSIQEFFDMYNTLFYQINELGPINSHQFLIKKSSDYIGAQEDNDLISLLQAEIAGLREQLLQSQKLYQDLVTNIPEAPTIEIPPIPDPPDPPPPPPPPTPPETEDPPTDKERVLQNVKEFPKDSDKQGSSRINVNKSFYKDVRKGKK
jgi:hypothetical protein